MSADQQTQIALCTSQTRLQACLRLLFVTSTIRLLSVCFKAASEQSHRRGEGGVHAHGAPVAGAAFVLSIRYYPRARVPSQRHCSGRLDALSHCGDLKWASSHGTRACAKSVTDGKGERGEGPSHSACRALAIADSHPYRHLPSYSISPSHFPRRLSLGSFAAPARPPHPRHPSPSGRSRAAPQPRLPC